MNEIIEQIREGKIDINNQELFFSTLIKGLMLRLDDDISIRGISVPHLIIHTGSDVLYLEHKGYDQSIEPMQVSNEDYTYNVVPRCVVSPGGIELVADQLTNPYSFGQFQYESNEEILNLTAEFRRMPIKLNVELKYLTDSYRDLLELTQQVLTKLSFIRTYYITYMGQSIQCSYRIPDSFSGEYITELDGTTTDSKNKTMNIALEVESNLPIISPRTIMSSDKVLTNFHHTTKLQK
jgi:hypothetical protein